ncbi:hypothetical protein D5R81_19455 [Parashewanella spongiae]|uniref:Uncharacterized protein n=2 Tax=Parashewanella spongiae TaxID=342950 RepID=A0A3A6TB32_9GAMM|nr:hypothetical protein [Parashewanella spongiae]RJY02185.1 hypothetical protein D5R81_19455 [Parashewanella spongiae]
MKPKGEDGIAVTDGCGQIPLVFKHSYTKADYKVMLTNNSLYFSLSVPQGSSINWLDTTMTLSTPSFNGTFNIDALIKDTKVKTYCSGLGVFNCKKYDFYYLWVDSEKVTNQKQINITPPTPIINGDKVPVSEIQFKKTTEHLLQSINC